MTSPFGSYKTTNFEWRQLASTITVSRDFLENLPGVQGVETSYQPADWAIDQLLMTLRAYVLTHPLGKHEVTRTKTIEWPATPWHHWKHRHATAWWLRWFVQRRPVQTTRQTIDYREVWDEMAAYPWNDRLPMVPGLGKASRVITVVEHGWTVNDE